MAVTDFFFLMSAREEEGVPSSPLDFSEFCRFSDRATYQQKKKSTDQIVTRKLTHVIEPTNRDDKSLRVNLWSSK